MASPILFTLLPLFSALNIPVLPAGRTLPENAIVVLVDLNDAHYQVPGNKLETLLGNLARCPFVANPASDVGIYVMYWGDHDLPKASVPRSLHPVVEFVNTTRVYLRRPLERDDDTFRIWQKSDFWAHKVFNVTQIARLKYIMRLEVEADFVCSELTPDPFATMEENQAVYGYYKVLRAKSGNHLTDFNNIVKKFIDQQNIEQPHLGMDLRNMGNGASPAFFNNFEMMYVPWFNQLHVRRFIKTMYETDALRKHRFGDGMERFMQIALFLDERSRLYCFGKELRYEYNGNIPGKEKYWCNIPTGDLGRMTEFEQQTAERRHTKRTPTPQFIGDTSDP